MEIIYLLTSSMVKVLDENLKRIDSSWWHNLVLDKLTFQQKTFADNLPQGSLSKLDLSSLLRIADQNWYELSSLLNLSKDARNWLKETQSIRNRWAHAPASGLPDDVVYRDIDTIERLLQALDVDSATLDKVTQSKKELFGKVALAGAKSTDLQVASVTNGSFSVGCIVSLKANPKMTGAVIGLIKGEKEDRYQVFHDGSISVYYESQLAKVENSNTHNSVSSDMLHAALTALQLLHPSTTHLYSLFSSRINFVPYQFRPVFKLINESPPIL